MRPHFRSDLRCSREEQQGVSFYRIDDPRSETNFRLYEIEYLIAQELNGERSLGEVVEVVKEKHEFDISEPDLIRFVTQLETMGFLEAHAPEESTAPADVAGDWVAATQEEARPLPELAFEPEAPAEVDQGELDRLLRSALMHVKQGYLPHARDYFLAARELEPDNSQLSLVISHLEIIGETPATSELEYIWEQASVLAPEYAAELGGIGAESTPAMRPPDALRPAAEEDLKSRVVWTLASVFLLLLGGGGLFWVVQRFELLASPRPVLVSGLKSNRVPRYFPAEADSVRAVDERSLSFGESGVVASVSVGRGDVVQRNQLIAELKLNKGQQRQLAQAKKKVEKSREKLEAARNQLQALATESQAIKLERDRAEEKLRELQPQQLLGREGVSRRDLEKYKRAKSAANKKLTKLAKKRRKPEVLEKKAKRKLDESLRKLSEVERRLGGRLLRSPISGRIFELAVKPGDSVVERKPVAKIRDERRAVLTFTLQSDANLQPGGQAFVAASRMTPDNAKVIRRDEIDGKTRVEIELEDPTGAYLQTPANEFRLVRDYVEQAFDVPASALSVNDGKPLVFVVFRNRARAIPVQILEKNAAQVIVTSPEGLLRNGDQVVTAETSTGNVRQLRHGSELAPAGG